MTRFKTLLLREWMQHQRGWIVLMALPLLFFVAAGLFGQMHFDLGEDGRVDAPTPLLVAVGTVAGLAVFTLMLAWLASLIQSSGLARRDVQDRSIEFWLSLPISHVQSLGATLLMHLLLVPWLALGVGLASGILVSLLIVAKGFGIGAWFALPWGTIIAAAVVLALRLMLGVLLATLWLSPLILGTMAASAWLKRWGLPVVAGTLFFGGMILDKVYGLKIVWQVLTTLSTNAGRALIAADRAPGAGGLVIQHPDDIGAVLGVLPGWALADAGHALAALASPAFVGAVLVGAAAFGLLWLRRQRGA
jgi:hypothetical protein